MCLQCVTEAETVLDDPILGYILMVAKRDSEEWPAGHYGLVKCNDPDFIWEGKPLLDPLEGMDDDAIDALADDSEEWAGYERFMDFVEKIRPVFNTDPYTGHQFVRACEASGYKWKQDGDVVMWFIDHIARKMEKNE
jgi:hypothetical protein